MTISKMSMSLLSSFVEEIFDTITQEAGFLSKRTGRKNLTNPTKLDIYTASGLVLPGGLGKHAHAE